MDGWSDEFLAEMTPADRADYLGETDDPGVLDRWAWHPGWPESATRG